MKQKSLLIVIDNLAKGGAEVLLVGILKDLNEKYNLILVTLSETNHFKNEQVLFHKKYNLGFKNLVSIPRVANKLKTIIKKHQPVLIHSHLYYSSLISRIACPPKTPLIYSLHSEMSKNVFNKNKILAFLEKVTIRRNHFALAVSDIVFNDYRKEIKRSHMAGVLKNYISDIYFNQEITERDFERKESFNLIAVGNIKEAKNYEFLLSAFKRLNELNISLDIYGRGDKEILTRLNKQTEQDGLRVKFMGPAENLHILFQNYDVFVSSSRHEGFGLAAIEAMASGLPLLLSDIPVYHEITSENALFFSLNNTDSFTNLIQNIFQKKYNLNLFSKKGLEISKSYTKAEYLKNLNSIYNTII